MSKWLRLIAPLVVLLVLAAPALAQSGDLTYRDEAGRLDRARVERAAQPLIARGARVAIYTVDSGGENDFRDRLQEDGLGSGGSINSNLVAIYISFDPRYSEIRGGDRWNAALATNNNIDAIRRNELNAGLAADDITGGVVNALSAIDRAIENPPTTGGGTTIINPEKTPEEIAAEARTSNLVIYSVLGLVLLFVGGPLLWRTYSKRRAVAQAFERARQGAEEARRQAGAAIADMGQALNDARAKAEYDQVSYAAADVAELARTQGAAEAQFVKAQERFDQAGETLALKRTPAQGDYEEITRAYQPVVSMVAEARQQLAQAEARRAELDKLNAAAPGEVDRIKKALADAAERLGALGEDLARPEAILRPVEALVAHAEALLAERRAADAMAAAQAASAPIEELTQALARYADLREGLSAGRAGAEKAATQGYRVEGGLKAFDSAEGLLRQAAAALEQGGAAAAGPLLDQAEAARAEGVARGGGMPALRRANEERLPQIRQAGEQLAGYITEGRRAFDMVDEFAESTWSDIRGNGSEAEAAAARAQSLWERAAGRNSMDEQDFLGAKEDLDDAEEQLAYARSLINTILQRLKDLETARGAAQAEIAAAQTDIDQGLTYVRSNDPDIGQVPEDALARAAALIAQANAELAKPRPDWLAIVRQAQEANRLADEALASARGEVEAMNKLREQVTRAQQLATAEVQKIVQFAGLHGADIPKASQTRLDALQKDIQGAYAALREAEQTEEQRRAAALRDALKRYTALESTADQLYDEIYAAFQRIEELRRRVASEAEQAANAIARADHTRQTYAAHLPRGSEGIGLLEQARQALASIGTIQNERDMERALRAATEARNAAERAEQLFRAQVRAYEQAHRRDDDLGDVLAGAVIGSMLSAGRRRGGSGGSGWGGSWGGGGGGSGSSSGGSWGGGSGGGGGWGGGSSSGGGW